MSQKRALKELSDMSKEIAEIKKRISKLESEGKIIDIVKSSSQYFPFTEQHYKVEGIDAKSQEHKQYYLGLLKNRYERIFKKQKEIIDFIDKIPTSRLRRIFEYRYIDRLSWIKIARKIGGNATADSVRMGHDRYLKKNK